MEKIKVSKIAFLPLIIFVVNLTIFLLIEVFEIVYKYSGTAKRTYLFFCLPLNILGLIISVYLLVKYLIYKKNIWNILLCLPLIIFIFYFYFFPLIKD